MNKDKVSTSTSVPTFNNIISFHHYMAPNITKEKKNSNQHHERDIQVTVAPYIIDPVLYIHAPSRYFTISDQFLHHKKHHSITGNL